LSNVLIIDTNEYFIASLSGEISRMGHHVVTARTLAQAFDLTASESFDVVFLNTEMPDGKGLDAAPKIIESPSSPEAIIFTDSGDPDEAEQAVRMGAWDYVERPSTAKAMTVSLARAMQYRARKGLKRPSTTLKQEVLDNIVGESPQMKQCLERLALTANSDANVLILGETGTGKELFAWAIHRNSRRAGKRFVVVDCAALPDTLVESTLFGYEKGAFTGADKAQSGLVKRADGGTLFLDEVGELPLSVQKSFLRVLHERRFRQVGGRTEIRSNFRLIAATNRDLDEMARRHQFRKDLLFRLRTFTLELPPLRERIEDIRTISIHHMAQLCESYGVPQKSFSPDFFETANRYDWPGNVRELINSLERAVSASGGEPTVFPKHLPVYIRVQLARSSVGQESASSDTGAPAAEAEPSASFPKLAGIRAAAIAEAEQRYIRELVALTEDMRTACAISGLSRSRLYAILKKYGVSSPFRNS
jgi:two-component system NtrC family response regulator